MNFQKNNPQKEYLRKIAKIVYYLGVGDYWYKNDNRMKINNILYYLWMVVCYFYLISCDVNLYLAYFRTDLSEKERNDLYQQTVGISSITVKTISFYYKRKSILKLLPRILERSNIEVVSERLDKACVRHCLILLTILSINTYAAVVTLTLDGIGAHIQEGIPIRTIVTYYPPSSASGLSINILRFVIQLHWWYALTIMAITEHFCVATVIIVWYKFVNLGEYFSSLREKVLDNIKNNRSNSDIEFRNDFIIGIKMHDDALWCVKTMQEAFGPVYDVSLFEGVLLISLSLIKLVTVTEDFDVFFLFANLAYISCMLLLTGSYMIPAGNLTHEASMVPTWMFHSGWELVPTRDTRILLVLALQRAQVPVVLKAFGFLELSYSNFVSILRSSYSFFAVMRK